MNQVSVCPTGREGPHSIPAPEVRRYLGRVAILPRAAEAPRQRQLVLKLCSPHLAAVSLPCFINNPGSCSQHIKVNRDASQAGNAGNSKR